MNGDDTLGVIPQTPRNNIGSGYFPSMTNPLTHATLNKLKTK
jgi:hypothetical protein